MEVRCRRNMAAMGVGCCRAPSSGGAGRKWAAGAGENLMGPTVRAILYELEGDSQGENLLPVAQA